MKLVALTAVIALGGCSLVGETRHPYTTSRGRLTCQSYALPVIDALVAAPTLAVGGLFAYVVATDPEMRPALPVAVIGLAIGVPAALGAIVGFRNIPQCNRELDAITPPAH